ncbi:MAG TPA: nicotinamide-nucleotide amidohydrolase family protein [Aggregatilineaceae bacterium]|nr:nicotinamide-nucleotide amidohydrolase family protein [Aggregatilineaceae bacterium]
MITLEQQVGNRLRERGWTISSAESSTGGLIMARLTDIAGSSAYVLGGVIAYADAIKEQILGVPQQMLIDYGAVSEPVAQQMAEGARQLFQTDVAVSVTGIAGPTGATATKPVGLHYIGLSTPTGSWVRRYVWNGDRTENRHAAADAALQLLLDYLDDAL